MKKSLIASALAVTLTSHAGVTQEVKFKRGESSAQISGAVIPGERDQYTFGAGKDQYLAVTLTSAESNAVLDIYGPGYKVDADGDVKGTRLSSASETTRYVGQLPAKGQYLIVVGGTRGNAQYQLSVGITSDAPAAAPLAASKPVPAANETRIAPTVATPPSGFPNPGNYKCPTAAGFDAIEVTSKGQFTEMGFVLGRGGTTNLISASAGRLVSRGPEILFSAEWMIAPAAVILGDGRWKRATGLSTLYQIRQRDQYAFDRMLKRSQDVDGKWENVQFPSQPCELLKVPSQINQLQLPAEFFR